MSLMIEFNDPLNYTVYTVNCTTEHFQLKLTFILTGFVYPNFTDMLKSQAHTVVQAQL